MYERVEAALRSLGLAEDCLRIFQENEMDDESLVSYLESGMDLVTLLASVIPPLGRRAKFIAAFKMQVSGGGGASGQATEGNNNGMRGSAVTVAAMPLNLNSTGGKGSGVTFPSTQGERQNIQSSQSGPTAVQIMEFEKVQGGNNTRKAILFESDFHQVIEKCDPKRPVAVLAIAGKANKGKSLFLSYVLRYLKALQRGNPDWMGWNDRTMKPLEGFRWANGYEVVTKGIWMWPEPITCNNSKGVEFDVLLMDTQGVFDEKTGQREWNILAGLGILTSSVMILNTSNDVQEDTLAAFQNFLEFGLLALDKDDSSVGTKPFQNLVFLVRDWENHEEFPFGHEGGRRFIKKKLEEKSDHDVFHRKLRKQMKKCFEDIDCFLFPYPGKKARESSFTGSVVNASEDYRSFAKEIQNCIEQLVHPDKFPFKTLNGNVLSAKDAFEIFKSYIKIFNSDELPSSNDLYNAAAERCNAVIMSKCVNGYVATLESSLSSVPFLEETELSEIQETAEEDAIAMFKKSRKMGDSEVISAAKEELKKKLAEKFSQFLTQNQIKKDGALREMETKVKEILTAYETEMGAKIGDVVFDQDQVHSIHNELASAARKKFQDFKFHRALEEEGLTQLGKHLQSPEKWLERVKVNCEKLEISIKNSISKAKTDYESTLDPSKFNDWTSMAAVEAEARQKALGVLKEFSSRLPESKVSEFETELTAQLDALRIKAAKSQALTAFQNAKKEFKQEVGSIVEMITDEEVFNSKVADLKSQIRSQLEKSMDESVVGTESFRENMSKWDAAVEELLVKYKKLFTLKTKEREINLKDVLAKAKKFYSDQMKIVFETKSLYSPEEFTKINRQALDDSLSRFQCDGNLSPDDVAVLRKSLQGLYQEFQEENEFRVPKDSHAIGIDLGTTYSCVGVVLNGKVEIIQDNERFTIPSCVHYDEKNNTVVGEAALEGAFSSPENFIFDAKRLIGRPWDDKDVQDDIKHWNFTVVQVYGQPRIKCRAGTLRPEEISAQVLLHLKKMAEKHLGREVKHAVVTVPAYFNDGQRHATKDAAKIAGLKATILTEPVAAAMAYRLECSGDSFGNKNVLVFDLGGGTFDIAILTISNCNLDVKTIRGDMHLGGEDFDNLMVKGVLEKVKVKHGRDFLTEKKSSEPKTRKDANDFIRRLKLQCEKRKRELSTAKLVTIRMQEGGLEIDEPMSQPELNALISAHLEKCMTLVGQALADVKMDRNDIHDIVLVGGSTKIPKVREMLKEYFKGVQLKHTVNPDQAVAYGAAIDAALKAGIGTQRDSMREKLTVQDVTPFSIGIENNRGELVVQVPKDSKIPYTHKEPWTTARDYQTQCTFPIFEGEDPVAKKNHLLGKFVLNVPSMKQGEVKMESTTIIDEEGILKVKAVCLIDGAQSDVVIDSYKGRMTEKEKQDAQSRLRT